MTSVDQGLFPHPVLVGDIGGTNARFALVRDAGSELQHLPPQKTADHADIEAAMEAALLAGTERPRSVLLCGAGPVEHGRHIALTNARWVIDGLSLRERFGLAQGLLLNDFEAQALALSALPAAATLALTPDLPAAEGPRVILGPGTGLGVGALIEARGAFMALPSEGGHVDFGPAAPDEEALWPHVERSHGRITAECLLSGPGLARLHSARRAAHGLPPDGADGPAIVARALSGEAPGARDTIALFLRLLARFAGDVAITFGASGGVYLSGGILPRLVPLLDAAAFRATFGAKAPVDALAGAIPIRLVVAPDAALFGLAAIAARPDRYLIDWPARLWRP